MHIGSSLKACWQPVARLWWRWQLARAEIALGKAGWQTADFGRDCDDMLRRLEGVERRQVSLINDRSQCARQIDDLSDAVSTAETTLSEAARRLRLLRDAAAAEEVGLQERLDSAACKAARFQAAARGLEQELAGGTGDDSPARPTWQVQVELTETHARLEDEQQEAGRLEAMLRQTISSSTESRKAASVELQQAETVLAGLREQLVSLRRRHSALEREIRKIEHQKDAPFRKLGSVMADAGLGPPNQPQLLERVLTLRRRSARVAQSPLATDHHTS